MARLIGPVCKLCRREREKLYLKGERCFTDKCSFSKRPYPPGERGRVRPRQTEYLIQLREKQKTKRVYSLLERQFRNLYEKATRQKGITGENLLRLLETRLDNVVYLLGLATSRRQARQLVTHGHIIVNSRKVNIPSYQLKVGDVVEVCPESKDLEVIQRAVSFNASAEIPAWLGFDRENLKGTVLRMPNRDEIRLPVKEQLIVELYSK